MCSKTTPSVNNTLLVREHMGTLRVNFWEIESGVPYIRVPENLYLCRLQLRMYMGYINMCICVLMHLLHLFF